MEPTTTEEASSKPPSTELSRLAENPGREHYYPGVSDEEWNDWRWQFRHRVTTLAELARFFPVSATEGRMIREVLHDFRMGITPYYLSLIQPGNPDDPILRQIVPHQDEYTYREVGDEDPLGEEQYSPVPGITHRYPDRVLMVISNSCAVYCRYCTRKRIMYEGAVPDVEIDSMVEYIARTPVVRDVVISGGDPMTYSTPKLERIIAKLRAIPHLEIIRIGTRVPVSLPQRVDDELCAMLSKYHPLWVNVHFNHPAECTPDAARACDKLSRAGIPLNNQSVLLRGINDTVATMKALVHGLMKMRVRPYYLYLCDPVRGTEHLRTPISTGIEVMEGLRGHTSGLAIPHLVIDAPGGGGKIPVGPNYLLHYDQRSGTAILRNYQNRIFEYKEPRLQPSLADAISPGAGAGAGSSANGGAGKSNGNGRGTGKATGSGSARSNGSAVAGLAADLKSGARKRPGKKVVGKSGWVHDGSSLAPARGPAAVGDSPAVAGSVVAGSPVAASPIAASPAEAGPAVADPAAVRSATNSAPAPTREVERALQPAPQSAHALAANVAVGVPSGTARGGSRPR